jgi:hypothetical protein
VIRHRRWCSVARDTRVVVAFASSLVLASAVVVGCGRDGRNAPGTERAHGTAAITPADLADMVLPKSELGSQFSEFEEASVSGPMPNHRAATETFADDTGVHLADRGRRDGYRQVYSLRASAPLPAEGLLSGGTYVELFEGEEAAGDYIDHRIAEFERARGEAHRIPEIGTVRYATVRRFAVSGIGDDAAGLEVAAQTNRRKSFETQISFRVGAIVARASTVSVGDFTERDQALGVAEALERRIAGVLGMRAGSGGEASLRSG